MSGDLILRNLGKNYRVNGQELSVIDAVSLHIQEGEFISIVGSSGCGKSTLLRLIVGLDKDFLGEIVFQGQKIQGTSLERGIVFQEHRLFPWLNVEDNIGLALKNAKLKESDKKRLIQDHIELVGLQGFEKAWPYQLSGGMAQRVAIARSLVHRPKLLLLDEPFGALDALTRTHLQNELQRIWMQEKITMILVTHDVEEAVYLGDRVLVMQSNPGQIKQDIPISLPHPRRREDARLYQTKIQILEHLEPRYQKDQV